MIIGIPLSTSKTQHFVNQAYAEYVVKAGFEPLLIPPGMSPATAVQLCDGLVLPGGIDIDPIYYGYDNYACFSSDPEKDAFERDLFHYFRESGKPVFGICRGMQLIAQEFVLSRPDMSERLVFHHHIEDHNPARTLELGRNVRSHFVQYSSKLYHKDGPHVHMQQMAVNSMHHQCLVYKRYAKKAKVLHLLPAIGNFSVLAFTDRGLKKEADEYTICEAFEVHNWGGPIMGVQWHPEELMDTALLSAFMLQDQIQGQHHEQAEIQVHGR